MITIAQLAKITIRVHSSRSGTSIQYSTTGRYKGLTTAGYRRTLPSEPLQPNASINAFWVAIIALVSANITANPNPP